jgi:flagellar biosynthesis chaperone FliJ
MKLWSRISVMGLCLLPLSGTSPNHAQRKTQTTESKAAASLTDAQMKNLDAYIDLLRKDVSQQKEEEIMGSVMVLSSDDAEKFWPIYGEYDKELTKLNDQKAENIKELCPYLQRVDRRKGR